MKWHLRSLVTTSKTLAEEVSKEIDAFVKQLSRKEIIQKSLDQYGYIFSGKG